MHLWPSSMSLVSESLWVVVQILFGGATRPSGPQTLLALPELVPPHSGMADLGNGHEGLPLLTHGLREVTRWPPLEQSGSNQTNFPGDRECSVEALGLLGARPLEGRRPELGI
eukprot:2910396-Pyramimonas_sp.AAC.1